MASSLDTASPNTPPLIVVARGDHICVRRSGGYCHHGIYRGSGFVIHYWSPDSGGKQGSAVRVSTLVDFVDGGEVKLVEYGRRFSAEAAVARAESKLGQGDYSVFANNCEHFATWCVVGEHSSAQIEKVESGAFFAGSTEIARRLGPTAVTGMGDAAPGSGANMMSGLKTIGGGHAKNGIIVLAAAGAVVGAGSMCLAFRDKEHMRADERTARKAARVGGVVGGAGGVGLVVYSVGALGVAGYGATGLSSGLSAFGAPLGGGMTAGLAVATLMPLLCAALVALVVYALARWLQPRSTTQPTPSAT